MVKVVLGLGTKAAMETPSIVWFLTNVLEVRKTYFHVNIYQTLCFVSKVLCNCYSDMKERALYAHYIISRYTDEE